MYDPTQSLQRAMEQLRSLEGMFANGQFPGQAGHFFDPDVWRDLEQATAAWTGRRPIQPMGGGQGSAAAGGTSGGSPPGGPASTFAGGAAPAHAALGEPRVDVLLLDQHVIVSAALPGIAQAADLQVAVLGENRLRLSGTIPAHPLHAQAKAVAQERMQGPFSRVLTLPVPVRAETAVCSYTNGLLEVRLERIHEQEQRLSVSFSGEAHPARKPGIAMGRAGEVKQE